MAAIDTWLEGFMHGANGGVWIILLLSLLLGLRHASDPDHLAAVTTLVASEKNHHLHIRLTKATSMGLLWGAGHATTLVLVGLPLVLVGQYLPEKLATAAEAAIGVIIVVLGVRLLVRWHRGLFHAHSHSHTSGETHRHLHSHVSQGSHDHRAPIRTPLSSYGVGLVHGVGGSGGVTLLLLSSISGKVEAAGALLLFAAGTAASMALLSTALGLAIAGGPIGRNFGRMAPALGASGMAFGAWYALGALGFVAYPF